MKEYQVKIIERLTAIVPVHAESADNAEERVRTMYRNSEIILTAENHVDTEFEVNEANSSRGYTDLPFDYQEKKREAKSIQKDILTARGIIGNGILRYKKKRLRARSKKEAEDLSVFDILDGYDYKEQIRDDYGWDLITETEMQKRMHLWDMREQYVKKSGQFSDRVTQILERAANCCGEEFLEVLEKFNAIKRRREADIARIERENRDNDYKRSKGLML